MVILREKQLYINFCKKLDETVTKIYKMPQQASTERDVSSSSTTELYCSMTMAALPIKLYSCIFKMYVKMPTYCVQMSKLK